MTEKDSPRTGAQVLVDALLTHDVDRIFGVPGESYLAVLDALYGAGNKICFHACRQEGGASYMADAYGKLTGRPGICFATRGPGATNASIGVHTAFQDSTPMILFIGQVARGMMEREAFQEIDYRHMFAPLAKWVAQIDDPARIPELVSRAFHTAVSGRPGPVVLALPEDMLSENCVAPPAERYKVVQPHPGAGQMAALRDLLARARRPVMIVGGGGWSAQVARDIEAFAEANNLPTGVGFRCQDYFDNTHPNYIGDVGIGSNPKLLARIKSADLILVAGHRLGEITSQGYTLVDIPRPAQTFVHVHAGASELGRVYQGDLLINAGPAQFAAAARALEPVDGSVWAEWAEEGRRDYLDTQGFEPLVGGVDMAAVVAVLRERLPDDAIITNGAGNFAGWLHRFYRYRRYRTQLAPTNGSMGYGVPAGIAAKAVHPERIVVSFAGDGDFLMTGQELATAMHYGLAPVIVVVNNGMYGTIRMHQEREFPGRVYGTELTNPDFAAYARAFGAHGETVERTEDFAPAFERALAAGRAAVIEVRIDPEAITPRTTLSRLREAALVREAG